MAWSLVVVVEDIAVKEVKEVPEQLRGPIPSPSLEHRVW
jgi:hypothetical protein